MERMLALLRSGVWLKIDELARELGASRRDVEAWIEEARLAGEPIVGSSLRGVRLSTDPAEVRAYARARRMRTLSVSRGTRQLLHTANRLEGRDAGQRTLFG